MSEFDVSADARNETGKSAMRRLRVTGRVPGVIYGAGRDPQNITVKDNELRKQLESESFFSHILTVSVGGEKVQAVLKDLQRNPVNFEVTHVDFLRVKATDELTMRVPLHYINEDTAPGAKEGGVFSHLLNDLEIVCLPADLPEFIAVDVGAMELGDNLHLSNLTLPQGVSFTVDVTDTDHDNTVVTLSMPHVLDTGDDEEEEDAEVSAEVPTVGDSEEEEPEA